MCLTGKRAAISTLHAYLLQYNVSPAYTLELLDRTTKVCLIPALRAVIVAWSLLQVFRDYCGVLSEESIRKNFILVYELLDEIIVRTCHRACFCGCTAHWLGVCRTTGTCKARAPIC